MKDCKKVCGNCEGVGCMECAYSGKYLTTDANTGEENE